MGEKGQYRTLEEIEKWRSTKDPIDQFISVLLSNGYATQSEVEELRASVRAEIVDAVAFADASPEPDISTIYDDIDSGALGVQL